MRVLTRSILLCFGAFFAVALIEVGLRCNELLLSYVGTSRSPTYMRTDNGTIYGLRSNSISRNSKAHINSIGFRGDEIPAKQDDELRIFVLGDSVTFGGEVDQDKTFVSQLQVKLTQQIQKRVRVINAGVPGYSIYNERQQFAAFKNVVQPDVVIIQFCANDIVDPLRHWNVFMGGTLGSEDIPREAIPDLEYHEYLQRLSYFRSINELRRRVPQLVNLLGGSTKPKVFLTGEDTIPITIYDQPGHPAVDWLKQGYAAFIKDIKSTTSNVLLLSVPIAYQLEDQYPYFGPQKIMAKIAQTEKIHIVEVTDTLRRARPVETFIGKAHPRGNDFWHLNEEGHQRVAEQLSTEVKILIQSRKN